VRRFVLAALLAGCYAVDYQPCALRCSEGVCPAPLTCGADSFCHSGDEATLACSADDLGVGDGNPHLLASFTLTTFAGTYEEHEGFKLQIDALDATGAPVAAYAGTPKLATDWGDLTVLSIQPFSNGAATAMVSLNRETDGTHGAHITITDGSATGSTSDLTIKAPDWKQVDGSAIFRVATSGWDQKMTDPYWVRWNGEYRLYYHGGPTTTGPDGIGYAHSPDGVNWTRYGTGPILTKSTSGWDMGYTPFKLMVQVDGAGLVGAFPANTGVSWGLARSMDGANWTRDPAGLYITGAANCSTYNDPLAFFIDGNKQYTWFETKNDPCFVLSTDDGMTIAPLQITTGFDARQPGAFPIVTQVVRDGSVLKMWYHPDTGSTGSLYATSTDGIAWVVTPSAVTATGPETVLLNEVTGHFEGLIYVPNGFARLARR